MIKLKKRTTSQKETTKTVVSKYDNSPSVKELQERIRQLEDKVEILWKVMPELSERLKESNRNLKNTIGAINVNAPDEKKLKKLLKRRQILGNRKEIERDYSNTETVNPSILFRGKVREMVLYWNAKTDFPKVTFDFPDKSDRIINPSGRFVETIAKLKKLLGGSLLGKPYTIEEFKLAVNRFQLMTFDNGYAPSVEVKEKWRKTLLSTFLLNERTNNPRYRSFFLYCMNNEPMLFMTIDVLDYSIYEFLMTQYRKYVGIDESFQFSGSDLKHFAAISDKLVQFRSSSEKQFTSVMTGRTLVKLLFKCAASLEKTWLKNGISPSLLNNPKLFTAWFPGYLRQEGYLKAQSSERTFGY